MKHIISILILTLCIQYVLAQSIDSCGMDNIGYLNQHEALFLNNYFRDYKIDYDFKGKRVLFITGSNGNTLSCKIDYFNDIKKWKLEYNDKISTSLVVLSEKEKEESGGYDAILLYWVKIFTDKSKSRIIKSIKI